MKLESLSHEKKILFALCLIERILHFYKDYNIVWENNGYDELNTYLEKTYTNLENNSIETDNAIRSKIELLIPDSDMYEGEEALFAQNASIALVYLFDYIKEKKEIYLSYIIQKVIETIDIIEFEVFDRDSDNAIKKEYELQNELVLFLEGLSEDITNLEIKQVREFARNNSVKITS